MRGPINVKSPNNTSNWQMGFNSAFKGLSRPASHPDMHKIRIIELFSLKICYSVSLTFGCYYLQYVPVYKPFDHA
jgi:hypothetical protein